MNHVEMRIRDLGEIKRGLDGQSFGCWRMCLGPIRQRSFRLAFFERVTRLIDKRTGLAMNASNRVGPKSAQPCGSLREADRQ